MNARHIPNALGVFRIVLIGPLVYAVIRGEFVVAFFIFGFAGFTDGLDGYLARRFDWRTRLGGIIDPLADKLLMVAVFGVFAVTGLVPRWLVALVIGRDMLIVLGGVAYRLLIGPFAGAATAVSKVNTAVQLLFVLLVLARAAFGVPGSGVIVLLGAAVMTSAVVSGLDYVRTWSALAWRKRVATAHD